MPAENPERFKISDFLTDLWVNKFTLWRTFVSWCDDIVKVGAVIGPFVVFVLSSVVGVNSLIANFTGEWNRFVYYEVDYGCGTVSSPKRCADGDLKENEEYRLTPDGQLTILGQKEECSGVRDIGVLKKCIEGNQEIYFQVNTFSNLRSLPTASGRLVKVLKGGQCLKIEEFMHLIQRNGKPNGGWFEVEVADCPGSTEEAGLRDRIVSLLIWF